MNEPIEQKGSDAFKVIHQIFKTIPGAFTLRLQAEATSEAKQPIPSQWILKVFNDVAASIESLVKPTETTKDAIDEHVQVKRYLEILEDYTWEKLNSGHWKDIPIVWRTIYSYTALFKVTVYSLESERSVPELLEICDKGLLMGAPILNNILSTIAEQLHSNCYTIPKTSKKLKYEVEDDFNFESIPEFIQFPESKFETSVENKPSLENFGKNYFSPQLPVVLTGTTDHWPAMEKWCPDYIIQVGGNRTVPIEIGSKYTSDDWTQKLMTIKQFAESYMSENPETTNLPTGYLAQHQLFNQMPELMKDIRIPDYCCLGENQDVDVNAWFGPAKTFTPIHHDPNHNLLAQVFGIKIIRLFPASENENLYPNCPDSLLFNTSQVDFDEGKEGVVARFPKFQNAKYTDIILRPGSVLYIPPKWWHMVKSLTPSFSVSFWFS